VSVDEDEIVGVIAVVVVDGETRWIDGTKCNVAISRHRRACTQHLLAPCMAGRGEHRDDVQAHRRDAYTYKQQTGRLDKLLQ